MTQPEIDRDLRDRWEGPAVLPDGDASLVCATCGRALDGVDADEDESGDAGLPICGECAREREFFDESG